MADIPVLAPADSQPRRGAARESGSRSSSRSCWSWRAPARAHASDRSSHSSLRGLKKKSRQARAEVVKGPPLYVALDPPFVVNFEAEQLVRFLQVTVQVMSRDQPTWIC